MITQEQVDELRRLTADRSPLVQTILSILIAQRTTQTAAQLGVAVDRSENWAYDAIRSLRKALIGVAEIEAQRGTGGGYRLCMLSSEERREAAECSQKAVTYEDLADSIKTQASAESPRPAKFKRTRHYYRAPWPGGLVDLQDVTAISLNPEGTQVVCQLRGGGYYRSPFHPRAAEVATHMEDVIESFDYVVAHKLKD